MRQRLEAEAKEKLPGSVYFAGRLSREEAIETMKRAAFLVVPSTWPEPFGLVIAEAFACGTPVIGAAVGAIQEMVKDQVTGLHFEAGNPDDLAVKVAWAWNNPRELAFMGEAARQVYEEQYSATANYNRLMNIYASVIDTRTGTSRNHVLAAVQL